MPGNISTNLNSLLKSADTYGNKNGKFLDDAAEVIIFMQNAIKAGYSCEDILEITHKYTDDNIALVYPKSTKEKILGAIGGGLYGLSKGCLEGILVIPAIMSGNERARRAESFLGQLWGLASSCPGINVIAETIDGVKDAITESPTAYHTRITPEMLYKSIKSEMNK